MREEEEERVRASVRCWQVQNNEAGRDAERGRGGEREAYKVFKDGQWFAKIMKRPWAQTAQGSAADEQETVDRWYRITHSRMGSSNSGINSFSGRYVLNSYLGLTRICSEKLKTLFCDWGITHHFSSKNQNVCCIFFSWIKTKQTQTRENKAKVEQKIICSQNLAAAGSVKVLSQFSAVQSKVAGLCHFRLCIVFYLFASTTKGELKVLSFHLDLYLVSAGSNAQLQACSHW